MGQSTSTQTMSAHMVSSSDNNEKTSRFSPQALLQLVQETCAHPLGSAERQRGLTQLIRHLTPQLWRTYDAYYADALQQTWIYFCRNLCEATTGRAYDPTVATVATWLNAYLRRRLQDFEIAENRKRAITVSQSSGFRANSDDALDPIDRLSAPPDVPPWLEQIRAWALSNPDLEKIHVGKHPQVTARLLILKRLPPETPWKNLAAEYGISIGTLSSFYQRQCLVKLREYGKSQGYF